PGWHIECSAMSTHFLGHHFDIHGGGKDLIFPHHENEIAQSEGAFGEQFVNVWIHNGFVNINQEKMSKSLGNYLMIKDILKEHHPEAVRLFLLSNHYRSPVDFTDQAMVEAEAGLEKVYALLHRINGHLGGSEPGDEKQGPGALWVSFCQAMNDDFNTARGIGLVFETVRKLNRLMDGIDGKADQDNQAALMSMRADLMRIGGVLGILTETASQFFERKKADVLRRKGIDIAVVERLIGERARARQEKDWAAADRIRDELFAMGILIEDRAKDTTWKVRY
ncbi:MAG TPA: cysteine--tRNA ligase, partial [Desulfobacterales bacterium]|nr:cysteine--tRNA ligase [Desulfobacterales bacterium]